MFNVIASVAQFEREVMLSRQREGIAKAKADGKYKGRAPTARAKTDDVLRLLKEGVRATDVAKRLGVGRRSVYRIIADAQTMRESPTERQNRCDAAITPTEGES